MRKLMHIYIVLLIIGSFSCTNNKYYYPVQLNLENNTKNRLDSIKEGDYVEVKFYINDTINTSSEYIIETPYNLYYTAKQGDIVISQFQKGQIVNQEINFNEKDKIPITPYYTSYKTLLSNKLNLSEPLTIQFTKSEGSYDKLKQIKLWTIVSEELSDNDEIQIKLHTNQYFEASKLPILKIDIDTAVSDKSAFANYQLINNEQELNKINDKPETTGNIKFKLRGQTSKSFSKQSYSIITYNQNSEKQNISLLGLPKEHDWVLYGPYVDLSLMRNVLAYELYEKMGYYSPRARFCELIINNDYRGVYVLIEKIKRDANRVNISKFNNINVEEFIVKLDKGDGHYWESPYKSKIDSGWGKWFYYYYPKYNSMNLEQQNVIKNCITEFENSIFEGKKWKEKIDVNNFVDYLIINELTKNVDAYRLSTYLYKDVSKLLHVGPIWDFNFSFGQTEHREGYKTDGWVFETEAVPFWWSKFMNDDEFKRILKERWEKYRASIFSDEEIFKLIDKNFRILSSCYERNNEKWQVMGSKHEFRHYEIKTIEEEIKYLKDWIEQRNKSIDQNIRAL